MAGNRYLTAYGCVVNREACASTLPGAGSKLGTLLNSGEFNMADDPLPQPVVDLQAEIALLKASEAPLIFFEVASTHGYRNGVCNVTLEAGMHIVHADKILNASRTVAHLRFPLAAIPSIRAALDAIELLAKPAASPEKN